MKPLQLPRRLEVETNPVGVPLAVRGRRGWVRVEALREEWRIDEDWWRVPISRRYYALVLEGGRAVTLYRDLESGGWYLQ
jgi:hypothetical protein